MLPCGKRCEERQKTSEREKNRDTRSQIANGEAVSGFEQNVEVPEDSVDSQSCLGFFLCNDEAESCRQHFQDGACGQNGSKRKACERG